MKTQVLIVGAGMSGTHTAYQLQQQGIDFILVEARDRLGGRAYSRQWNSNQYDNSQPAFDMGPAWFWPGQTRMEGLVNSLGLEEDVFLQTGEGDLVYEDHQGRIQRGRGGASMAGSYRMRGGIRQIIETMGEAIRADQCWLDTELKWLRYQNEHIQAELQRGDSLMQIAVSYTHLTLPTIYSV